MLEFDIQLFYFLNSVAGHFSFVDTAIVFFAEMALPLLCLIGVIALKPWRWPAYAKAPAWYYSKAKQGEYDLSSRSLDEGWWNYIVLFALTMTASWSTNALIGLLFFRPRPYIDQSNVHLLVVNTFGSKSFPSDHTVLAFAFAFSLYLINKKFGYVALVVAFLIGMARIMAGVHYPFDVLAAIGIGCAWAWFIGRFLK